MKRNVVKTALILSLIALGACTAAWGRSFTMIGSSPDYVKYRFYLSTVDEGGMNKEARDYCAVYLKNAVLEYSEPAEGNSSAELINTYQCVQPGVFTPNIGTTDVIEMQ
jgi:hypothetical protein